MLISTPSPLCPDDLLLLDLGLHWLLSSSFVNSGLVATHSGLQRGRVRHTGWVPLHGWPHPAFTKTYHQIWTQGIYRQTPHHLSPIVFLRNSTLHHKKKDMAVLMIYSVCLFTIVNVKWKKYFLAVFKSY